MYIIGVTGGIATGKSSVVSALATLGAPTTSADSIARGLLVPGSALTRTVLAEFPFCQSTDEGVLPAIDRHALAKLIFSDAKSRTKLEALTHPPIVEALKAFIKDCRGWPEKAAAVEIPLLYELGLRSLVDGVLVVSCSHSTQIERLMARQNLTMDEAERWIAIQWPLEKKCALAEYVVDNDGDFKETENRIKALWDSL